MARPLRRVLPLLLGAACLIFVAACGSDSKKDSSSSDSTPAAAPPAGTTSTPAAGGGGAATIKLDAIEPGQPEYTFDKRKLKGAAGSTTIVMTNVAKNKNPHGIAIEGNGLDKDGQVVQPGGTSKVTVDLKPGKYTFYCPVPGHRQEGMEGTLTIT